MGRVNVDPYRGYRRDYSYRHRYARYCSRYCGNGYSDDSGDDNGYDNRYYNNNYDDGRYYDPNDYYYDNDGDKPRRRHHHHDHEDDGDRDGNWGDRERRTGRQDRSVDQAEAWRKASATLPFRLKKNRWTSTTAVNFRDKKSGFA